MTEAGIDSGFTRDLFVALGEQLKNGDWSLRIYVKPFINWIWLGTFIMAFGGILSISDKRYRVVKATIKPNAAKSPNSVLTEQTF
jgi:cytochrome c-type biogenesis protein CcmF